MLHSWCVVSPKTPWGHENLGRLLASRALKAVTFRPELLLCHRIGPFWIVSASANGGALGIQKPYDLSSDGACASMFWGLPLDHSCPRDETIAAHVHRRLHDGGPDVLQEHAGGAWNAVHIDERRIVALSSFSGYGSLCIADGDDFFAVGNRASMLASLTGRESHVDFDRLALSWIFSMATIIGERTAFSGVRKIPPGNTLTFEPSRGMELRPCRPGSSTPLADGERREVVRGAIERMSQRLRWSLG